MAGFIGVDIGGTRIKAGRVDDQGTVAARLAFGVGDDRDEAAIVERVAAVVEGLAPGGVTAVGVAVAGVLDHAEAVITESPNFPSWQNFALGARLQARLGALVYLENDANAAIFGEALAGVGQGVSSCIGLTLGTGVGGAIILGGEIYRGERGMAGELGHLTVNPAGRACNCGNHGCLERYAGALGIAETMRATRQDDAVWQEAAADRDEAVAWLAERAAAGDPDALQIFGDVGEALGQTLAGLLHVFDIRTFILCGGISGAFEWFKPRLEATLRRRTFRSMQAGVTVLRGILGDDAALVGASVLARRRMGG